MTTQHTAGDAGQHDATPDGMTAPPWPTIRIGETAVWRACPRCRRHTLTAYVDGLLIHADPENLSVADELAAQISDRLMFDIRVYGLPQRMHMEYRHLARIGAARAYPVVTQHRCGNELTLLTEKASYDVKDIVISYGKPQPDIPPF